MCSAVGAVNVPKTENDARARNQKRTHLTNANWQERVVKCCTENSKGVVPCAGSIVPPVPGSVVRLGGFGELDAQGAHRRATW